jgi:4-hydroxy-3-polyprenylbenzoate decarboxylase
VTENQNAKKIIVSITGASGVLYGIRALELLKSVGVETHLVVSSAAYITISQETDWKPEDILALADYHYSPKNIGAAIASGSFTTQGMIVAPRSIKTLSAIANSYTDNLIIRAADVTLKEGRPLLLAVREAPFHRGHLRLMSLAAEAGAIIFPPIPYFYGQAQTVDEIITGTVGRMLARIGIQNQDYTRWQGLK